jgi:SHS2 domain-containing protein
VAHTIVELDHTADTGIVVSADDLAELFAATAQGMFDIMYRKDEPAAGSPRRFSVDLDEPAEALWSLLSDLLSHAEADGVAFAGIEGATNDDGRRIVLEVRAVPVSEVETVGPPVKAVTWHRFEVARSGEGWTATVVFDV